MKPNSSLPIKELTQDLFALTTIEVWAKDLPTPVNEHAIQAYYIQLLTGKINELIRHHNDEAHPTENH